MCVRARQTRVPFFLCVLPFKQEMKENATHSQETVTATHSFTFLCFTCFPNCVVGVKCTRIGHQTVSASAPPGLNHLDLIIHRFNLLLDCNCFYEE